MHLVIRHTFSQHMPHVYPHSMFQQPSVPIGKDSITIHNYQPHAATHNLPVIPHNFRINRKHILISMMFKQRDIETLCMHTQHQSAREQEEVCNKTFIREHKKI